MMSAVNIAEIGLQISNARRLAQEMEPPSRTCSGFSLNDGYAVGRFLHEEQLRAGARQVGAKLGFTNQAVWRQLGLSTPFWSPIYDTTVTDAASISLAGLVQPRIEPEIMLGFRSDVPPNASPEELSGAVGWVAAGFEIVQCHYPGWVMTPADAVADGGLHAILAVGSRVEMDASDLTALADVEVELWHGTTLVSRGRGSNALGGPIQAIAWLLRLPGVNGLRAGDVVTTGTLTSAQPIGPSQLWRFIAAGVPRLQNMTVRFDVDE